MIKAEKEERANSDRMGRRKEKREGRGRGDQEKRRAKRLSV
jgi:hypothetical protein